MGSLSFGLSNAYVGKNKMDGSLIARARLLIVIAFLTCHGCATYFSIMGPSLDEVALLEIRTRSSS